MKKRTTITTEKREIWIISEGDLPPHIPGPASSTDRAGSSTDTALVRTEQVPTPTNEMDGSERE